MTIVFYDKKRETFHRIEKVWYMYPTCDQIKGRGKLRNLWRVTFEDATQTDIPMSQFEFYRVDATA